MGNFISLGQYNKLYKYIWIYLGIRFVYQFIFDYELVFDQLYNEPISLPYSPFISMQLFYITFIIVSLIIKLIQKKINKNDVNLILEVDEPLIFNKSDIVLQFGTSHTDYFLFVNLYFVVVTDLLDEIFYQFNLRIMNYWMFEMLFFELMNSRIQKIKIYKHHIFSFIFILCFCSIIKTISIILSFLNNTKNVQMFNDRKFLIPVGLSFYLLMQLFKAYIFCNEKYYLEKRYISIINYMFFYGLFGFLTSTLCAVLSSFIPCGDNSLNDFFKTVCAYEDKDIYYFDNYKIFFKELAKSYLGLRIFLLIFQCGLYYSSNYYIYVIYKKLSPIYHICMKRFNYLILDSLVFINDLVNQNIQGFSLVLSIFDILLLIFFVLGSVIYLEFFELNFCELNFYMRKRIKERSKKEISFSLDNISSESENSSSLGIID